ncbi:MAG: hypothetical protein IJ929_02165 [Prevotella sp.]|nr:hypothetical protein [Prevotella sp.]
MKKILMSIVMVIVMLGFTACSDNNDNPSVDPMHDVAIVGSWYANTTNKTFPLWNYGPAWNKMTFNADGTGHFDTFYILENRAIARDNQTFTYTTTSNGHLTMEMEDGTFSYTYQFSSGQLMLTYDDKSVAYDKADANMMAKFDAWSQQELIKVPNAARYTVFVYGNAGGDMDWYIEKGFWEQMKPLLTDSTNVRVVCFYKYGMDKPDEGEPFSGMYSDPGDIVWFELSSKTDLNKLREEGLASHGFAEQAKKMKLCDPASIRMFMELSSLICPAEQYIFAVWGHGSGFDPTSDVPGKYNENMAPTRGVIGDEWNNHEQLNMYELAQAIRESGAVRSMNTIFFHNCLMGNMETLTELRDVTEYICCSAHSLSSDGIVLSEFVKGLMEQKNTEDAVKQMFRNMRPNWDNQYPDDINEGENLPNGDFKMLRTSKFDALLDACQLLATRLVALYPTQHEAIDRATNRVYRFCKPINHPDYSMYSPFFDMADYAHKLAEETGDNQIAAISDNIDRAFNDLIIHYGDVSWNEQHLDHYTLSVCLYSQLYYNYDLIGAGFPYQSNIGDGYEQCAFHKLTGWGNFLRINEQIPLGNPCSQGGEPLNNH